MNNFFPVSPEYLQTVLLFSQIMQLIWYPTPVFRHTPSIPVSQGKHCSLWQCSLLLLPGTVQPGSCGDFRPLELVLANLSQPPGQDTARSWRNDENCVVQYRALQWDKDSTVQHIMVQFSAGQSHNMFCIPKW